MGGSKTVKDLISESDAAKKWGILDNGTNQGVKHFSDYWEKYPERIPSLEQRLGVTEGSFIIHWKGLIILHLKQNVLLVKQFQLEMLEI